MQKLLHLETDYWLCLLFINALTFKYNMQLISYNFYFLVLRIWNGILFPKLFWPSVRKKCSSDREKPSKFKAEGREYGIYYAISKTIYSNNFETELIPGDFSDLIYQYN